MRRSLLTVNLLRAGCVVLAALVCAGVIALRYGPTQWPEPPPTAAQLRTHWQAGLRWMREHEADVLADGNPMLWRMVRDAQTLSGDTDLADLLRRHRLRHFTREPVDAWVLLIDPNATPRSPIPRRLDELPGYMKLFAYGMSCNPALGASDAVQYEMSLGLCSAITARRVLRNPKCVTHQLVGFMLVQQRGCGDAAEVASMTRQLQDRVVDELALDFVMRDEHLQRVLVLYWTGAPERVKPVWLNRLLRAQRHDGGWDYASAYSRWVSPDSAIAAETFHATAQAMLVIAMALQRTEAAQAATTPAG
jgi:hypothetical protein